MGHYQQSYLIKAPIEKVALFHRDSQAIKKLTPPPVLIQIHLAEPLAEGSRSVFTMWFGPIPVKWTAVHSDVDPDHGFTDTQERGPMKYWKHSHRFIRIDNKSTRIEESIQYEHNSGITGLFTRIFYSSVGLRWLFYYRQLILNRILCA